VTSPFLSPKPVDRGQMMDDTIRVRGRRVLDFIEETITVDITWDHLVGQLSTVCDLSSPSRLAVELVAISVAPAVQRCDEWLDALDCSNAWYRSRCPVQSFLSALIEDLSEEGELTALLEAAGRPWAVWDDGNIDDRVLHFDESDLRLRELTKVYSLCATMATSEDVAAFCQCAFCLGFTALALRDAIRAKPRRQFVGKNLFLCWSGGDYVQLSRAAGASGPE
jgi:hypothetical protein